MNKEEVLTLKKGDKVKCNFKTSRGQMIRDCTFIRLFHRRDSNKLYAMVTMDGNILGNLFPIMSENIISKL